LGGLTSARSSPDQSDGTGRVQITDTPGITGWAKYGVVRDTGRGSFVLDCDCSRKPKAILAGGFRLSAQSHQTTA
jgi:hypothetical protein